MLTALRPFVPLWQILWQDARTHTPRHTHMQFTWLPLVLVAAPHSSRSSSGWGTVIMHVARTDTKDLLATGTGMPHTVPPLNYETVGLDVRVDLFDLLYTLRLT